MDSPREILLKTTAPSPPQEKSCYCQDCGAKAPTKYVEFYRIIGAVVLFHFKTIGGNLCKSCIHKYFWDYTLLTLGLGWWSCLAFTGILAGHAADAASAAATATSRPGSRGGRCGGSCLSPATFPRGRRRPDRPNTSAKLRSVGGVLSPRP